MGLFTKHLAQGEARALEKAMGYPRYRSRADECAEPLSFPCQQLDHYSGSKAKSSFSLDANQFFSTVPDIAFAGHSSSSLFSWRKNNHYSG